MTGNLLLYSGPVNANGLPRTQADSSVYLWLVQEDLLYEFAVNAGVMENCRSNRHFFLSRTRLPYNRSSWWRLRNSHT